MKKCKNWSLVFKHFMLIDGKKVDLNLENSDLPDRCKLALAEMFTGQNYELVKRDLKDKL